jgi:hypothetical protein
MSAAVSGALLERDHRGDRRVSDIGPRAARGAMNRPLEAILGVAAAGGTAFLVVQVARYDMGMTGAAVRTGALSAAGLVVAVIAAGAMLKRR